ncbi:hypothetical protein L198_03094 [Cryptococcus wingfieldii CBS 7118]|uniref:Uncharacterized protein n=1 Tax=Cryptococcus wingfieldii CBS 7118 TaxID=1295528 RepID=A0A1E3JKW9_9TREE|nr:hypothetical protein L198_03094 [Cryptococcus wingfieldii CBS 7118]ODO00767.1 hypothetical protein L198_03094 [Cryptococcus wingfieldii CBS 7118]
MPSTYPITAEQAKPAKVPGAFRGVVTGAGHSSVFLSPVQERRILNWREGASTVAPSQKTKSAPPSVGRRSSKGEGSLAGSCAYSCAECQAAASVSAPVTSCSCTFHSVQSRTSHKLRKKKGPKSYYSNRTAPESSNMTPTLPAMMTVRPKTPPAGSRPPKLKSPGYNQFVESQGQAPSAYGLGMGMGSGAGAPTQWVAPQSNPMAASKPMTAPKAELPRVAGVRDPISTAYFRRMFPPAPGQVPFGGVVMPGAHPPQAFGMPAGGPYSF